MSARGITSSPPKPIPEARFNAARLAVLRNLLRRRRHAARGIAFALALVLGLISLGAPLYAFTSSEGGYARQALPVETGVLLDPPDPPPPDMAQVWAAARAKDRSPGLATRGKLARRMPASTARPTRDIAVLPDAKRSACGVLAAR